MKMDEAVLDYKKPLELFASKDLVKICAPMVRYSRLPFRSLVRKYHCDLAFTPMIVSESFVKSIKARDSEFTTNKADRPLIVQFAANNPQDFADGAEIVQPYADGIDLNCGCPQRWAQQEGYGACLMKKPRLLMDIVSMARARVNNPNFTVSIKIRIHKDLKETVSLCQQAEKTGVSWITVHGRTREQRAQPVNMEAIRLIKDSVAIPVIANGDIRSLQDAHTVHEQTGVNGVMAARGILSNPAMYAGYKNTPLQCVQDWVDIALSQGIQFQAFHHHLGMMFEKVTSKAEKHFFNSLSSMAAVLDFLREHYGILHPARHDGDSSQEILASEVNRVVSEPESGRPQSRDQHFNRHRLCTDNFHQEVTSTETLIKNSHTANNR